MLNENQSTPKTPLIIVGGLSTNQLSKIKYLPKRHEISRSQKLQLNLGGNTLEMIKTLKHLGFQAQLVSALGNDAAAKALEYEIIDLEIDRSAIKKDHNYISDRSFITYTNEELLTEILHPGASQAIDAADIEKLFNQQLKEFFLIEGELAALESILAKVKANYSHSIVFLKDGNVPLSSLKNTNTLITTPLALSMLSQKPSEHVETAKLSAKVLFEEGIEQLVIYFEKQGILYLNKEKSLYLDMPKVDSVAPFRALSALSAGLTASLIKNERQTIEKEDLQYALALLCHAISYLDHRSYADEATLNKELLSIATRADWRTSKHLSDEQEEKLAAHALNMRKRMIRMLGVSKSGHPGGSLSLGEILSTLYFHQMNYSVHNYQRENRDRLLLSKGHAAPALYAALMEVGVLDASLETELRKLKSPLQGHPDMKKCAGVEMSTGSLGQGLSVAHGMALAAKQKGLDYRVYCILGDGEIQEGQIWEAAMSAVHQRSDNLCAILDYNALQIDGCIGDIKSAIAPIREKWEAFGWHVIHVDGHDLNQLAAALAEAETIKGKPTFIVAQTVKGKSISFMEGNPGYHGSPLTDDEVKRALSELEAAS